MITGDLIDDCRFKVFCQCYLAKSGYDVFLRRNVGLKPDFSNYRKIECGYINSAKIVLHPHENHPMDDCTFLHLDLFRLILFTGWRISLVRRGETMGIWRPAASPFSGKAGGLQILRCSAYGGQQATTVSLLTP
jgi:hypothetical protein